MNKRLLYALFVCIPFLMQANNQPCDPCDCKATSHTFYSIRPVYGLNSPERLALSRHLMSACPDGYQGGLQIVPFGGRTTKSDHLARFFFPNCKRQLNVNEALGLPDTDILANQLNIYTVNGVAENPVGDPFSSIIRICPRQTFAGVGITYQQEIAELCGCRSLWFSISAPVTWVQNEVNLQENVIEDGGGASPLVPGAVANVTQAFRQPSWLFGRIDNCDRSKTKLGDVDVLLGYQAVNNDCCRLDSYAGALFPGGNRPCGRRVFEPIVGSNGHYGVIFGSSLGVQVWACDESTLEFAVDISGQYLFKRTEIRSVDLKNKPFSRYMSVYINEEQATEAANADDPLVLVSLATPGINIFTLPLSIKPGFSRTVNTALVYTHCNFLAEIGYNFFARQSECAELACRFNESSALRALQGGGFTDPVQQIGNNFANANAVPLADFSTSIITADQLDLESAAHPAVMSHTVYGSLGYEYDTCDYPLFFGIGGSYEFSADNTGIHRWMGWGKFGISF